MLKERELGPKNFASPKRVFWADKSILGSKLEKSECKHTGV